MKNFLSKILTHRDSFYPESISQNEKIKITDIVVKHFNLKDANQLRDKFEGVAFLNNFTKDLGGVMCLGKCLDIDFIDLDIINPLNFSNIITIGKKKFHVITFNYGEFPVIEPKSKVPVIFIINKDFQKFWITGIASLKILNDISNQKKMSTGLTKSFNNKTNFIAFSRLENINIFKNRL